VSVEELAGRNEIENESKVLNIDITTSNTLKIPEEIKINDNEIDIEDPETWKEGHAFITYILKNQPNQDIDALDFLTSLIVGTTQKRYARKFVFLKIKKYVSSKTRLDDIFSNKRENILYILQAFWR